MLVEFAGILEIAGHYQGKDKERLYRVLSQLRGATIAGHSIAFEVHDSNDFIKIPGFGYRDYHTDVEPAPWGVFRYFGIRLFMDYPSRKAWEVFGRWSLPGIDPKEAQLVIALYSKGEPLRPGQLQRIGDEWP